LLQLSNALGEDGFLARVVRAPGDQLIDLLLNDLMYLRLVSILQRRVVEGHIVGTAPLRRETGFGGGESPQPAQELTDFGLRADIREDHQHVARSHPVAIADADLPNNAAFEVLHAPPAALRTDHARCDGRTRQGSRRRPSAADDEEAQQYRRAEKCWATQLTAQ
jgi:hypothetical protein